LGDRDSTILPSSEGPSTLGPARCDVIIPVDKGKTPFVSLGMHVVSENESQLLRGSGLEIIPLRTPLIMFWEVAMVRPVFILCAVDLMNPQDGEFDQPGLARKITHRA
jgi:hypothetical protein